MIFFLSSKEISFYFDVFEQVVLNTFVSIKMDNIAEYWDKVDPNLSGHTRVMLLQLKI